jgi:hypothetical protein
LDPKYLGTDFIIHKYSETKRVITISKALVSFLVGISLCANLKAAESWADAQTSKMTAQGWTVIATQNNLVDPMHPSTFFTKPVTGIWFAKLSEERHVGPIVIVPILSLMYDFSETEQLQGWHCFNLRTGEEAIVPSDIAPESVDPSTLHWIRCADGTPGDKMVKYFQR